MQYNTPQSGHCVQNKTKPLCNHCVNCSSTVHYVLSAFPQLQVVGTKINDMEKLVCILCFYFKKSLKVKKTQAFLCRNFSEAIKCDFFMYCQANTIPIFFYLKKRRKRRKKEVFSAFICFSYEEQTDLDCEAVVPLVSSFMCHIDVVLWDNKGRNYSKPARKSSDERKRGGNNGKTWVLF